MAKIRLYIDFQLEHDLSYRALHKQRTDRQKKNTNDKQFENNCSKF